MVVFIYVSWNGSFSKVVGGKIGNRDSILGRVSFHHDVLADIWGPRTV
jgi:hypothetical protein